MGPVFEIGLIHFLIVSILLVAAGVATILTKRNAIGILIGIELILNAAGINLVAFNHYSWPSQTQNAMVEKDFQQSLFDIEAKMAAATPSLGLAQTRPGSSELDVQLSRAATQPSEVPGWVTAGRAGGPPTPQPAIDGQMFAVFIIVLAAAEAAVALAIFLNFYNNFSTIDVEQAEAMKG